VASNRTSVELTWKVAGMFVTFSNKFSLYLLYILNVFTPQGVVILEIEIILSI
jgi:hypothetical protein